MPECLQFANLLQQCPYLRIFAAIKHFMQPTVIINLPASKSICNRVLLMNALSARPQEVRNLSDCDDTQAMQRALSDMRSGKTVFDIGAAGTAMRFLAALLAGTPGEWILTGSARMKQRPIRILVDALNSLGADIAYLEADGFPPLRIRGKVLQGGSLALDGSVSSQYISALMMVAPCMRDGLQMELRGNLVSRSYVDMTASLMRTFGAELQVDYPHIAVGTKPYSPAVFTVENDWSAASYWYEWLAVAGEGSIFLPHLYADSLQGDSHVADIFRPLGVETKYMAEGVQITASGRYVPSFAYDFVNQPDLAQTVAVACCLCGIPFKFNGLQTLKIKETDRIAALIAELGKLGFVLQETNVGELSWDGARVPVAEPVSIATYQDHRMAMSFAPAAMRFRMTIEHPEVVTKSYPGFWEEKRKLMLD